MWLLKSEKCQTIYTTRSYMSCLKKSLTLIYDGFEEFKQIQEIQIYKMKRTWAREQIDLHRVDVKWNEERYSKESHELLRFFCKWWCVAFASRGHSFCILNVSICLCKMLAGGNKPVILKQTFDHLRMTCPQDIMLCSQFLSEELKLFLWDVFTWWFGFRGGWGGWKRCKRSSAHGWCFHMVSCYGSETCHWWQETETTQWC